MASIKEEIKQSKFASPQQEASINISFTAHWLNSRLNKFLKPHKLTSEQFNVLRILRGKNPGKMRQKDILERMVAPQSNLTLIVKKLKNKEFIQVEKSSVDGREYVIGITDNGLNVLSQLDKEFKPVMSTVNKLNDEEAQLLSTLLDKLRSE